MRPGLKSGIALLVIVLILTALMQAGQKERINWKKTFDPADKIPYGTFVLKRELSRILPGSPEVISVEQPLYQFMEERGHASDAALLYVGSVFSVGEAANRKLLDFVDGGGTLFIAAEEIDPGLMDSLGADYMAFNEYESGLGMNITEVRLYLSANREEVTFDKISDVLTFDQLRKETTTVLGYAKKGGTSVPDFIRVKRGKGQVLIHLEPRVFTNYYLLQERPFELAFNALQYVETQQLLWYDGLFNNREAATPLRFILGEKELRAAWYTLLAALALYLVFKSKREQRAVPVIEPERNLSVSFAKTIGSLYHENGNPGNMVLKKITYFLFEIRKRYHVDTQDLLDAQFIFILNQRTGMPEAELLDFFRELQAAKERERFDIADLKNIYQLIEQFKQKAKL